MADYQRKGKVISFYASPENLEQLDRLEVLDRKVTGDTHGFTKLVRAALNVYEDFLTQRLEAD